MIGFDFDEAYLRLAAQLEDSGEEVAVHLRRNDRGDSLTIQVGVGANGCRGAVAITEVGRTRGMPRGMCGVAIRSGMSYRLRLDDLEIRRVLLAVWTECDRQGVI